MKDPFLTILYKNYFERLDTVNQLDSIHDFQAKCEKCGSAPVDRHNELLRTARNELSKAERLIDSYLNCQYVAFQKPQEQKQ